MADDIDQEPETSHVPDSLTPDLAKTIHGLLDNLPGRIASALGAQLGHLPAPQINALIAAADGAVRDEIGKARAEVESLLS